MASNNIKWYKKVFGDELIRCSEFSNDNSIDGECSSVPIDLIFDEFFKARPDDCKLIIALYFSPVEGARDECSNYLIQLYRKINSVGEASDNSNLYEHNVKLKSSKTLLEVIQVILTNSVHWLDRCTLDETKVLAQLKDYPWYALPVRDRDRTMKLTRRYDIKSLTPSLILLNGRTGKIITKHGRDRLLEDPTGVNFPWKPRPLHLVLQNVELQYGGKSGSANTTNYRNLKSLIIGFYFSAHWCPPCKGFTPQLIQTYNILKKRKANFEIIFVSSDRSEESHKSYFQSMPWLGIPYAEEECRRELASLFGVQGIPTLVVTESDGSVITYDGRGEINDDPAAEMFPWRPRPVNVLTERQSAKLQDSPAVILFVEGDDADMEFAESVLSPAVKEFAEKFQDDDIPLEFFVACDNETSDTLREFIGMDDYVPLLALVNIPDGTWSALEEAVDINEDTVTHFVARYLKNELPMQSICKETVPMNK